MDYNININHYKMQPVKSHTDDCINKTQSCKCCVSNSSTSHKECLNSVIALTESHTASAGCSHTKGLSNDSIKELSINNITSNNTSLAVPVLIHFESHLENCDDESINNITNNNNTSNAVPALNNFESHLENCDDELNSDIDDEMCDLFINIGDDDASETYSIETCDTGFTSLSSDSPNLTQVKNDDQMIINETNCKTVQIKEIDTHLSESTPLGTNINNVGSTECDVESNNCIDVIEQASNCDDSSSSNGANKEKKRVFVCEVEGCDKKFSKPSRLQQHIRIHTGERPYTCPVEGCDRSYTRSQHLRRHRDVTHSAIASSAASTASSSSSAAAASTALKTTLETKCPQCERRYASVYSLRKHVKQFHAHQKHACVECGLTFLKQQQLRRHHTVVHTGGHTYPCQSPGCSSGYASQSKLVDHTCRAHTPRRFVCTRGGVDAAGAPRCTQRFDRHTEQRIHEATAHPFTCFQCGVECAQREKYKQHLQSHRDLRFTFMCEEDDCGGCYYSLTALRSHVRDKHRNPAPPRRRVPSQRHHCDLCNENLATKQKFQLHQKVHSPDYVRSLGRRNLTRRPRKDKGVSRTDYRKLLSGLSIEERDPDKLRKEAPPQEEDEETAWRDQVQEICHVSNTYEQPAKTTVKTIFF